MMDFTPNLPGKHDTAQSAHKSSGSKRRKSWGLLIALIVTSAVAVSASATAVVYIVKYNNLKKDPNLTAQNTKQTVVDNVSKLYDVPKEEPTLARVSEVEKLKKEQDFFKNAQNGDYILVFPNAKLGILYRETTNKIINIGPVQTQADDQAGTIPEGADETQDQQ
jgi:hypothetical protein